MSRIAHARGGRRVAILTGLLLGTFLAALIAGTCIGTLAAGIGGAIHRGALRSPVLDLPGEFLMAWGSSILDVSRLLFFQAPDPQVAILAWPFIAGFVVAPLLMVAPMVGMQGRRPSGIPLRWSIAGASMLGGLIALGVVLVPLDLVRLLVRHQGGVDPIRLMGEWNFYASMLALWAVAGLVWARVLARAGRHGHPDRVTRFVRWLFAGTCVELALAAPTYAMASRKSDCWCDWLSWWSIVAGAVTLAVLCGPMLVLLWTRDARLHWVRKACVHCGYPGRGGSQVCPECGKPLSNATAARLRA